MSVGKHTLGLDGTNKDSRMHLVSMRKVPPTEENEPDYAPHQEDLECPGKKTVLDNSIDENKDKNNDTDDD